MIVIGNGVGRVMVMLCGDEVQAVHCSINEILHFVSFSILGHGGASAETQPLDQASHLSKLEY